MRNNLFNFATSELSQDAFICWCANWFNHKEENEILFKMSQEFLKLITRIENIKSVDVYRQVNNIDVLIIINKCTAIIIEDKTFSSEHDDQIQRYKEKIGSQLRVREKTYYINEVRCIYYKTGELYPSDDKTINNEDVHVIPRKDMLELTNKYTEYSDIVRDYNEYLMDLEHWYQNVQIQYLNREIDAAFSEAYGQLLCIEELFGGLKMVGAFSNEDTIITTGSSRGKPYTWAWIWGRKDWYWLGFRLDSDARGYYLSLRQYLNYKRDRNKEKIAEEKSAMFNELRKLLDSKLKQSPYTGFLHGQIGRNNGKYNESEIAKFYFSDNSIENFKKYLMPLLHDVVRDI